MLGLLSTLLLRRLFPAHSIVKPSWHTPFESLASCGAFLCVVRQVVLRRLRLASRDTAFKNGEAAECGGWTPLLKTWNGLRCGRLGAGVLKLRQAGALHRLCIARHRAAYFKAVSSHRTTGEKLKKSSPSNQAQRMRLSGTPVRQESAMA